MRRRRIANGVLRDDEGLPVSASKRTGIEGSPRASRFSKLCTSGSISPLLANVCLHYVAVMREGRLAQVAPPLELHARPADTFVATFIGSPPMNLLPADVAGAAAGAAVTAGIRPHDVVIGDHGPYAATVDVVEPRGHDTSPAERRGGGFGDRRRDVRTAAAGRVVRADRLSHPTACTCSTRRA